MQEAIKKGDRFEMYRVIEDGGYKGQFKPGTVRVGYAGRMRTLVNVLSEDGTFRFLQRGTECIHVSSVKLRRIKSAGKRFNLGIAQ